MSQQIIGGSNIDLANQQDQEYKPEHQTSFMPRQNKHQKPITDEKQRSSTHPEAEQIQQNEQYLTKKSNQTNSRSKSSQGKKGSKAANDKHRQGHPYEFEESVAQRQNAVSASAGQAAGDTVEARVTQIQKQFKFNSKYDQDSGVNDNSALYLVDESVQQEMGGTNMQSQDLHAQNLQPQISNEQSQFSGQGHIQGHILKSKNLKKQIKKTKLQIQQQRPAQNQEGNASQAHIGQNLQKQFECQPQSFDTSNNTSLLDIETNGAKPADKFQQVQEFKGYASINASNARKSKQKNINKQTQPHTDHQVQYAPNLQQLISPNMINTGQIQNQQFIANLIQTGMTSNSGEQSLKLQPRSKSTYDSRKQQMIAQQNQNNSTNKRKSTGLINCNQPANKAFAQENQHRHASNLHSIDIADTSSNGQNNQATENQDAQINRTRQDYTQDYQTLLSGILSAEGAAQRLTQGDGQFQFQVQGTRTGSQGPQKRKTKPSNTNQNMMIGIGPQINTTISQERGRTFFIEDIKSTQSMERNSLKSNKSAVSRISRYSKNSKNSKQSKKSRHHSKQNQQQDQARNYHCSFTQQSKSRSTKSVNRPKLIAIQSVLGQTPINPSIPTSIPNAAQMIIKKGDTANRAQMWQGQRQGSQPINIITNQQFQNQDNDYVQSFEASTGFQQN